jgi:DNA-directed RNA polymerase omega subunit
MARVTVEDCLARIPNRFALTILASRRARALGEGRGHALVECENKEGVTALREISRNQVRYKQDVEEATRDFIEEQRRQLRVTTGEHTFLEAASLRALEDEDVDEEEEADEDIEELQSDPEALGKQAKKSTPSDDDEEESDDAPVAETEESEDFEEEEDSTFEEDIPAEAGAAPPEIDDDDSSSDDSDDSDDD